MDKRTGKEYLQFSQGEDTYTEYDWKIIIGDSNAGCFQAGTIHCSHDGEDVLLVEVKADDAVCRGAVCLKCLIKAMGELGILAVELVEGDDNG